MTEPIETEPLERIDYAARRRERALQRANSSNRRWVLVGVWVLVGLLLLAGLAEAAFTTGRVHPGVTVSGVRVGGMTRDNAEAALRTSLPPLTSEPVVLSHEGSTWEVLAQEIALDFDYTAQVNKAMSVGRAGGMFAALGDRVRAWTSGVDVAASPRANLLMMDTVMARIAKDIDIAPVDATVKIEGTDPEVVDGEDGRALDRAKAAKLVLAKFAARSARTVDAPVEVDPMRVTALQAAKAATVAEQMLDGPVTVTYKDDSWEFEPAEIAPWIVFAPAESNAPTSSAGKVALEAKVSAKAAGKPVTKALGTEIGRPAKDARFKTSNGRVTIVPSEEGIGPDIDALALALTDELTDAESDREVELRTVHTEPKLTTQKAKAMGIEERISTYRTTYESGNRPRVNNIHLLGDALDGTLIKPGGTFSFNGAAGERTAAKGYQEANAIVNGKLVPQLGGGVCQVGTTVFNAVFESGFPIVERRNHSFYISHYPTGRDATVSWGGPDLKFKNDSDHWVLVSVSYTAGSITVSLYGTDPGYDVEAQVGEWTNTVKYGTEKIKDPELSEGTEVVEESGITGRTITVKRIVKKGGKVVRTDQIVSKYKPKDQVIRVGTKKKSGSSKETTKTP